MDAGCLDEAAVLAYLAGDAGAEAEAHVAECSACRAVVRLAVDDAAPRLVTSDAPTNAADPGHQPTEVDVDALLRPAAALAVDQRVGRYRITGRLGHGGMGVVYAAHDPDLDRRVAIKLLRNGYDRALLVRESRAIARLAHPNVVTVYDVGVDGGRGFVAMELVDGGTLDRWLAKRPRTPDAVLRMFAAAGAGLAAAHAAGIVHRDFKPANVLVGVDGRPRVSDFGLAVAAAHDEHEHTDGGFGPGTPAYMAPEQFDGGAADARSDQFSFAVALFEALDGKRPFLGDSAPEIRIAIDDGPPPLRAAVPTRVARSIARALSADPAARFPSMEPLLRALVPPPTRRLAIAATATAALAAGVAVAAVATRPKPAPVCRDLDRGARAVWGPPQRDALLTAFAATGAPGATEAAQLAADELDRYLGEWSRARQDACEAAQVRRDQTPEQQALRTVCLDERLADVRALTDVLARPDRDVVAGVPRLLGELTPIDTCADLRTLGERTALPGAPARRAELERARDRLARIRAEVAAGLYPAASASMTGLVETIAGLGYRPLEADAALVAGQLANALGRPREARAHLRASVLAAEAGRDDRTAAQAWLAQARIAAELSERDAAADALAHAAAVVERIGNSSGLTGDLDHARGVVARGRGDRRAARAAFASAVEHFTAARGDHTTRLVDARLDLAIAMASIGEVRPARELADRALAELRAALGPDHAELGAALIRTAGLASTSWDLPRATAELDEAARILTAALPPEHPQRIGLEVERAFTEMAQEQHAEARAHLEDARARYVAVYGEANTKVADVDRGLADVALRARDLDAMNAAVERARRGFVALTGPDSIDATMLGSYASWAAFLAGDGAAAVAAARAHVETCVRLWGERHVETAHAHYAVAMALVAAGDDVGALPEFAAATRLLTEASGPWDGVLTGYAMAHGESLIALERFAEAEPILRHGLEVAERGSLAATSQRVGLRFLLAGAYRGQDQPDKAVALLDENQRDPWYEEAPAARPYNELWLGVDLIVSGLDVARGEALLAGARRALAASDPDQVREADRWLRRKGPRTAQRGR